MALRRENERLTNRSLPPGTRNQTCTRSVHTLNDQESVRNYRRRRSRQHGAGDRNGAIQGRCIGTLLNTQSETIQAMLTTLNENGQF